MRAEIARRYRRCLQATQRRSQLRERAVRPLEISLVPGIVLICPWGRERRPGAGDVSPSAEACASKACPKQGVCPASRSSHTIPAHHPGHYHHSSGSPHPDTRGWAQTATPRPQPPHSEDGQRSPPLWSAPALSSSAHTLPAALLHAGGQGAPSTLGSTPEQAVEAAPQLSLCTSSSTVS